MGHLCQQLSSALPRVTPKGGSVQGPAAPTETVAVPAQTPAQRRQLCQLGCLSWASQSQEEPQLSLSCDSKPQAVRLTGRKRLSELTEPFPAAGQEGWRGELLLQTQRGCPSAEAAEAGRRVLCKCPGSALAFPQALFQPQPRLLSLSPVRVSCRGTWGLNSSTGYATNHRPTKTSREQH